MEKIAIVGAGLIGCAWATVFARAGHPVALYDASPEALRSAPYSIGATLAGLDKGGLIAEEPETVLQRVTTAPTLEQAVQGAVLVQENIRETVEAKKEIFAALDRL